MFDYVKDSSYGAPDIASMYQWKRKLSKRIIQKIEEKIGDRLLLRGYELSGYPRITISSIGKTYIYLHSRIGIFHYRVRKYGAVLVIREMVARRFGLEGQRRRMQCMIDKIDDVNLK
jgi:hypothetical protein